MEYKKKGFKDITSCIKIGDEWNIIENDSLVKTQKKEIKSIIGLDNAELKNIESRYLIFSLSIPK